MGKRTKRAELYREELRSGMTCKAIAEKYGISVQAVYAACGSIKSVRFRRYEKKDCVWRGLRNWLNAHEVSRKMLLQEMGLEYSNCNLERLRQKLTGKLDIKMSFIRKMMEITGMDFEDLFEVRDDEC